MLNSEPEIYFSELCRQVTREGITVRVEIYRVPGNPKWALEVLNPLQCSAIWDELFDSDTEALAAFEAVLDDEGICVFFGGGWVETLH
jgi:hypothetical protein